MHQLNLSVSFTALSCSHAFEKFRPCSVHSYKYQLTVSQSSISTRMKNTSSFTNSLLAAVASNSHPCAAQETQEANQKSRRSCNRVTHQTSTRLGASLKRKASAEGGNHIVATNACCNHQLQLRIQASRASELTKFEPAAWRETPAGYRSWVEMFDFLNEN